MGDLNELVERLRAYAGEHPNDYRNRAADALTSLMAERDGAIAERDKAQDIGIKSIKRAQDAYRQSVASARHLANIIRAYDENSGHEPSVSVLARAIDEARTALSLDTNKGDGV